jgi:hypothetical protein
MSWLEAGSDPPGKTAPVMIDSAVYSAAFPRTQQSARLATAIRRAAWIERGTWG